MRVAINIEFNEQELERFADRWTNRFIVTSLSQVLREAGPVLGPIGDAVMRAVAGQAGQVAAAAGAPGGRDGPVAQEPLCGHDGREELLVHCVPIQSPHVAPGWACHACRTFNGLQRPQCKNCGHARCGPHFTAPQPSAGAPPEGNALDVYDRILGSYPAEKVAIVVQRVNERNGQQFSITGPPRDGLSLGEAIKFLEPRTEATTYAVRFFDEEKFILGYGLFVLPATEPEADATQPKV